MQRIWIETFTLLLVVALVGGCAARQETILPHGSHTMLDIWEQESSGMSRLANRQLLDTRQHLRRPITEADVQTTPADHATYTRTASNEIEKQFHRLPNPDLVMYVFPHLAGSDPAPVPGYTTVFPLYRHVHYAMPGERAEDD